MGRPARRNLESGTDFKTFIPVDVNGDEILATVAETPLDLYLPEGLDANFVKIQCFPETPTTYDPLVSGVPLGISSGDGDPFVYFDGRGLPVPVVKSDNGAFIARVIDKTGGNILACYKVT